MHSVLVQVLPKMAGIVKALDLIEEGALDPFALPSVVASPARTCRPHGIDPGKRREGPGRRRHGRRLVLAQLVAFALAIMTLLPFGGRR